MLQFLQIWQAEVQILRLGGDDSENSQANKEIAIKSGGLLIIGTERHESRRIDNQLKR